MTMCKFYEIVKYAKAYIILKCLQQRNKHKHRYKTKQTCCRILKVSIKTIKIIK